MDLLRIAAMDEDDLAIVSAHVQDAVLKVSDLAFRPGEHRFALAMNRFVWEANAGRFSRHGERRRSVLSFDRVTAARSAGVPRDAAEEVLSLLALRFSAGEAPAGTIEMVFSGDAAIQLDVECIECRLADLGPAWDTPSRPRHGS